MTNRSDVFLGSAVSAVGAIGISADQLISSLSVLTLLLNSFAAAGGLVLVLYRLSKIMKKDDDDV